MPNHKYVRGYFFFGVIGWFTKSLVINHFAFTGNQVLVPQDTSANRNHLAPIYQLRPVLKNSNPHVQENYNPNVISEFNLHCGIYREIIMCRYGQNTFSRYGPKNKLRCFFVGQLTILISNHHSINIFKRAAHLKGHRVLQKRKYKIRAFFLWQFLVAILVLL